jgi:hypothetical protein
VKSTGRLGYLNNILGVSEFDLDREVNATTKWNNCII